MRRDRIILGAGALVQRRGRLLVVKRAMPPDLGLWAFPGGRVEVGETTQEAAVREVKEEVGLDVRIERVFDVVTYLPGDLEGGTWGQVVIVDYLARPERGEVKLSSESSSYLWATPRQILALPTTKQMKSVAAKYMKLSS